jgi:RimJ/RimL family protein N-acetyltransferase
MARIENHKIELKNGTIVEIGSACSGDEESLLKFGQISVLDHDYQAMYPDEFNITLEQEFKFVEDHLQAPNKLALVARIESKVIAMLNFDPVTRLRKMAHIVTLGAGVLKEHRNLGIGQIMMNEALDWVKNNTQYEKVELRVLASNERAIHMYKKLGFVEEARLKKEFKFSDTDYRDDVFMALFIER